MKNHSDPVDLLNTLGDQCEDAGFWILASAAAHLNGYNLNDGQPSTVATYLPEDVLAVGQPDGEYKTRLEADRVTTQWKVGSTRKPKDLAGSPLFPVEKERGLFDAE
jgi:hypothetical protein